MDGLSSSLTNMLGGLPPVNWVMLWLAWQF